ncbi:hypothetical protein ACQEV4_32580 [Streptomyces shenzhenensis]|uniref:hypothetical protein n=1 Tax=Streptomyces shenzhenensis TaxID=943815 RepID=UPI003D9506BE
MDLGQLSLEQALVTRFPERSDHDRQPRRFTAGPHAVAELPRRYGPEGRFPEQAAAAGVAPHPLSARAHARTGGSAVRPVFGYAHLTPARIRGAGRSQRRWRCPRPGPRLRGAGGTTETPSVFRGRRASCSLVVSVVAAAHQ